MSISKPFVAAVCGVVTFILIILILLSFSSLEYHEVGFLKNKITGSVDISQVYFSGLHFVGITQVFKVYRFGLHNEIFARFSIANKEKLRVKMTCSLQYVLKMEDLALLHDAYDLAYRPVLRTTALAAIKGAAPVFTVDQYRINRTSVAKTLFEAASKTLGGICCRKDCVTNYCRPGCKKYSRCKKQDKGMFADVKYFQLQLVELFPEQKRKYLQKILEDEKKDTEIFRQDDMITRKITEQRRVRVEQEADEVLETAIANSTLIRSKADVLAKHLVDDARNKGLQYMYTKLNIVDVEQKNSLDYVRTLRNSKNSSLYVGFQYMVAKP